MARHRSSRKKQLRENIKIGLIITGICLIIALVVSLIIGKMPSFIEGTINKQIEGEIGRTVGKDMNIDDLKKKYKKYMK